MVIEILSYATSPFNPLLKLLVPVMFVVGTYFFYQAQKKFGGNLKTIASLLMWGGAAGVVATAFRYFGDYIPQYKWGESIVLVIFAIISLVVVCLVYSKFIEIARAFGMIGGDES